MIRFVEMKGIYLDNNKKSFGFYDTVKDIFVCIGDTYCFDTIKEFEECYDNNCKVEFNRLKRLIPKNWLYDNEPL